MMLIAVVVLVLVIIIGVAVILLKSVKKLKSITITPNFAETELDVNQDYVFSIKGNPSKAKLKNLEYIVDDATATFAKGTGSDEGSAILHTAAEGTVTVYVKKDKIESNKITLQVVDQARKAQEEAAAAEKAAEEARLAAEAAAAEEEEVQASTLVMVTGDNVRMRAEANTDCDIVRTCKQGETYEKVEAVDDWTKVLFEGRECYIKTEFLKEVSPEEAETAKAELANKPEEEKKEEEKKDEKKTEEKKEEAKPAADQAAADAAAAEAEQAKKDAEAAQAAADAAAQAAAAAAAATTAAPAGSVTINCSDGPAQFSKAEYDYFVATWSYTGMADEMMTHHSAAELHNLYNVTH